MDACDLHVGYIFAEQNGWSCVPQITGCMHGFK